MRNPITFDRFIRGLIVLLIIVGVAWCVYWLRAVLLPFFVAWVIAYLLYPLVHFLQYKCRIRNRILAIFITLFIVIGILGGFFYIVVPPMLSEIAHVKDFALDYLQKGATNRSIPLEVEAFLQKNAAEYDIDELLRQDDVKTAIKNVLPKLWDVLWSTASVIFNIIASLIGLLYLFFLLTDYEKYAKGWIKFIPRSKRSFASKLVGDVEEGMAGYFRGQALIALSNCVMFSIGFLLIDFPVPIGLGCFIGVISFVPYLQVIGFLPATLLALLKAAETGQNFWWLLCLVLMVYLVVQILQDTIFTPRIMGHIMGLPPAIILLSLSVWGYMMGILGLIIALPLTTLMISYYKRYIVGSESMHEVEPPKKGQASPAALSRRRKRPFRSKKSSIQRTGESSKKNPDAASATKES